MRALLLFVLLGAFCLSQAQQNLCQPGTYFELFCQACNTGEYQDQPAQTSCKKCADGTSTLGQASRSANDCYDICEPGHRLNTQSRVCDSCGVGFYGAGGTNAGGGVVTTCTRCPSDRPLTATETSSAETECRAICPAGSELDSAGDCKECAVGFYKSAGNVRCEQCPANRFTPSTGATSPTDCSIVRCPVGQSNTNGVCSNCASGYYQDETGQDSCKECGQPVSYFRTDPGADSLSDCQFICPDGEYINGPNLCSRCAVGSYRSNSVDGFTGGCVPCAAGLTTAGVGSKLASDCNLAVCGIGQQNNPTNQALCEPCPRNTYQDEAAQASCKTCQPGYLTQATGSTSSSSCQFACPSGMEERSPGSRECTPCAIGFYKDNTLNTFGSCTPCNNGRITAGTGATSASQCDTANCRAGTFRNTATLR